MHFGLSEEQSLLRDTVRRYFSDRLDIERIKEMLGGSCPNDLWQSVIDMGLMGVVVPEEYGGSNLSLLDATIVAEALGEFVVPVPLTGALMAVAAISKHGDDNQKERYLHGIANGSIRVAHGIKRNHAALHSEGNLVTGRSAVIADVAGASHYLLNAGDKLLVVDCSAPGIRVENLKNVDRTRSFAIASFDNTGCDVIASGNPEVVNHSLAVGRLSIAAETFGAAEKMFEDARAYSLERYQFDRPIGSFQSIKHQLSDMISDLEPCRSLLWYAAYTYDAEPEEFELHSCLAKSLVSDVAKRVAKTSLEIHGGMGYTELLGLHLWFKRIETNRQLLGGPEDARSRAAEVQQFVIEGVS